MLPHMVVPCEVYVQVCTVFPVVRLIPSLFSLSTLSLHIYIYWCLLGAVPSHVAVGPNGDGALGI